jgi:hypothetical protein
MEDTAVGAEVTISVPIVMDQMVDTISTAKRALQGLRNHVEARSTALCSPPKLKKMATSSTAAITAKPHTLQNSVREAVQALSGYPQMVDTLDDSWFACMTEWVSVARAEGNLSELELCVDVLSQLREKILLLNPLWGRSVFYLHWKNSSLAVMEDNFKSVIRAPMWSTEFKVLKSTMHFWVLCRKLIERRVEPSLSEIASAVGVLQIAQTDDRWYLLHLGRSYLRLAMVYMNVFEDDLDKFSAVPSLLERAVSSFDEFFKVEGAFASFKNAPGNDELIYPWVTAVLLQLQIAIVPSFAQTVCDSLLSRLKSLGDVYGLSDGKVPTHVIPASCIAYSLFAVNVIASVGTVQNPKPEAYDTYVTHAKECCKWLQNNAPDVFRADPPQLWEAMDGCVLRWWQTYDDGKRFSLFNMIHPSTFMADEVGFPKGVQP